MKRALTFLLILCTVLSNSLSAVASNGTVEREYKIKAAFLYNFTKYTTWPDDMFDDEHNSLNICVFGQDPFGQTIDTTMRGKTVKTRQVNVMRILEIEKIDTCHMLFISSYGVTNLSGVLAHIADQPILTIADAKNFAKDGGMINLLTTNNRIRLEINTDAVDRSGVHLNSQLLKLAKIVKSD